MIAVAVLRQVLQRVDHGFELRDLALQLIDMLAGVLSGSEFLIEAMTSVPAGTRISGPGI